MIQNGRHRPPRPVTTARTMRPMTVTSVETPSGPRRVSPTNDVSPKASSPPPTRRRERPRDDHHDDPGDRDAANDSRPCRQLDVAETRHQRLEPRQADGEQDRGIPDGQECGRPGAQRPREVVVRADTAGHRPGRGRRTDVEHRGTGDAVRVGRDDRPGNGVRTIAHPGGQRQVDRVADDGRLVRHDFAGIVEHPHRATCERDLLGEAQCHARRRLGHDGTIGRYHLEQLGMGAGRAVRRQEPADHDEESDEQEAGDARRHEATVRDTDRTAPLTPPAGSATVNRRRLTDGRARREIEMYMFGRSRHVRTGRYAEAAAKAVETGSRASAC